MFKFKSKVVFTSAILGTLYAIYLLVYFTGAISGSEGAEQIGASIAAALVAPHMALVILAVIFNWVSFFANKSWATLTSGILYSVAGVIFLLYIVFVIPMIILSFVGMSKVSKINKKKLEAEQTIS